MRSSAINRTAALLVGVAGIACMLAAQAQSWPSKPVKLVVPFTAGGSTDTVARIVRQNLAWALAYNVIMLPLAAAGWVTPWLAGIGMGASSLLVVLNASRLMRSR